LQISRNTLLPATPNKVGLLCKCIIDYAAATLVATENPEKEEDKTIKNDELLRVANDWLNFSYILVRTDSI
jgi:hypothetical protein